MAIEIPRALVEFILLGPEDDRRQLQDSPILGDVWIEFARFPDKSQELLITPYKEYTAGIVASALSDKNIDKAEIAYLQGTVAACLSFTDVVRYVVPMTYWWSDRRTSEAIRKYLSDPEALARDIKGILSEALKWVNEAPDAPVTQDLDTRKRYIVLAGLILWARDEPKPDGADTATPKERIRAIVTRDIAANVAQGLTRTFPAGTFASAVPVAAATSGADAADAHKPLVWTVSLNRRATPALSRSVPAVKADAARTLFTVRCNDIVWAVVDSGIDGNHRALCGDKGASRVWRSFDFTRIRRIVSMDYLRLDDEQRKARVDELLRPELQLKSPPPADKVDASLQRLATGAREGRPVNWELVEKLIEIHPGAKPHSHHGTHVAGIIGASSQWKEKTEHDAALAKARGPAPAAPAVAAGMGAAGAGEIPSPESEDWVDGMCPDIRLCDFRVLAPTFRETEFAIIAALQFIRHINERNSFITIHGANLSLSIPHDVRNYACGRTPICNECERLVNSGVVVVAAAGNRGYQNFATSEGQYESYAAFSVTDPGNADGVITVGATHRFWPHTYGVSFFSSRGPTGDGRLKPDLVAPGERIRAPLPGNEWGDLDGTSMAAPHVSGAAAMLMARYTELIGQPRRIKDVLCRSATDLGRERSFQGHGMLDVLRAFQSI